MSSTHACGVFGGVLSLTGAPVAQRIERWPPEPGAGVRVAPGAPSIATGSKLEWQGEQFSGRGAVVARMVWDHEVVSSNLTAPTI